MWIVFIRVEITTKFYQNPPLKLGRYWIRRFRAKNLQMQDKERAK